ncbi:PaaI family thioesterase [Gordonia rubripertincta]|uniref:PaaI family thioesterase n=1 Tax=Gordonia rubripertincta TaxID=36822 RepID=UPI000B8D3BF3|nr:hotdog domain-containing protein [Gordonia rubripertincta]ASR02067.1 Thioesterase superfamily protein [Gordonia rubripertincta]
MEVTAPEFVLGGAERLLRVSEAALSPDSAELCEESGGWLADPGVGVCRGALGVILDDVTGYVVAAGSPPDRWPVSLGIRLDLLADPPVDGSTLTATGRLVARDDASGTTRGEVCGPDGNVLALITQRSHLLTVTEALTTPHIDATPPGPETSLRAALAVRELEPGVIELPPNPYAANGMGNIHGGILITGAEFAAMSALGATGQLRTNSIDTAFVRPADAAHTITFRSRVQHRGRSMAVVEVAAVATSGKPCALATVIVRPQDSMEGIA